jgi:hypothetical protein
MTRAFVLDLLIPSEGCSFLPSVLHLIVNGPWCSALPRTEDTMRVMKLVLCCDFSNIRCSSCVILSRFASNNSSVISTDILALETSASVTVLSRQRQTWQFDYLCGVRYVSHPAHVAPNPDRMPIKVTPIAPIRKTHSSVNERGSIVWKTPWTAGGGRTSPR